jgi:hypothetical protein
MKRPHSQSCEDPSKCTRQEQVNSRPCGASGNCDYHNLWTLNGQQRCFRHPQTTTACSSDSSNFWTLFLCTHPYQSRFEIVSKLRPGCTSGTVCTLLQTLPTTNTAFYKLKILASSLEGSGVRHWHCIIISKHTIRTQFRHETHSALCTKIAHAPHSYILL